MNNEDIEQLTALLKKLEPGFLPYQIFEQIARLVALPILEIIPLRSNGPAVEVLLIKRDSEDPIWPNLFHTPGTVIRATDLEDSEKKNWLAFERIFHAELNDTEVGTAHYVGSMFHRSKRGYEQAQIYWVEVLNEPKVGSFFDTQQLPDTLMESQSAFIKEAVRNYTEYKSQNT